MNLRPVVRASVPMVAAVSLTLLLAACGSSSTKNATAQTKPSSTASAASGSAACKIPAGSTSNAVKVSGAFGKDITAKVTGTLNATGIERTVVTQGSGATPLDGMTVNTRLSLLNGTGKKLVAQDAQVPLGAGVRQVFLDALECLPYGSRTVVTAPASQVYDASTMPAGVTKNDTLIIVADLESAFAPAAWTTQVPSVTWSAKGVPAVKLVGKPMKAWAIKILRQGTGAVVKPGDNVTVNYQGTSWNTGKIFDSSYGGFSHGVETFATTQVVTGFGGALVDQKVGTRLIVTIPPQYGYGATKSANNQLGGQTLVFVVEIEKTASS